MIVETLMKQIDAGREGLNKGLSSGLPKLDSLTYGIIRENITLIGASSGAGKSSLTSYMAIYNAYNDYLKSGKTIDIWWLIFSFEMSETALFLRLLSMHLWDEYHLIVPHKTLLSLEEKLSDEIYKKILDSREWLNGLADRCTIVDRPVTAKGMYGRCKSFSEQHGQYVLKAKGKHGEEDWESYDYIPNNPQQYLVVVIDHVKLFDTQPGHTSKQEIDEACKYLIHLRDKCKYSVYMVQQLNRAFQDMSRRTENGGVYADIQLSDKHKYKAINFILFLFLDFIRIFNYLTV